MSERQGRRCRSRADGVDLKTRRELDRDHFHAQAENYGAAVRRREAGNFRRRLWNNGWRQGRWRRWRWWRWFGEDWNRRGSWRRRRDDCERLFARACTGLLGRSFYFTM